MLAATDSAHHAPSDHSSPQEILEQKTWKSQMPRLFVKHAPTTSTPTSEQTWLQHQVCGALPLPAELCLATFVLMQSGHFVPGHGALAELP